MSDERDNDSRLHFNGLTPREAERLALLAEECAEVIQVIMKIKRHGFESHNPFDEDQITNRELLQKELGHLDVATTFMIRAEDIDPEKIMEATIVKQGSIGKYLHHQPPWVTTGVK